MLKLLIVKTSSLGDVIHNLPVIADIRAHYPDIEIDWLVEESFADIPKLHPAVNQLIPAAIRRWRKAMFNVKTWQEIKAFKKQLTLKQHDLVLDTQGLIKSGFMTHFSQGVKHGYDRYSIREPIASFFYDKTHPVSRNQHAVARNRTLAALALDYPVPESLPEYGIQATTSTGVTLKQPYVVGLHATSRASKLWPTEHWIALGNQLAQDKIALVLPWASQAELKRAQQIASALNNTIVLPQLSIAELATIISQSQGAIGVDTGLSHLAAALSIPTVAIYIDTNPALTGVYAGKYAPAVNLGGIALPPSVDMVLEAFNSIKKSS